VQSTPLQASAARRGRTCARGQAAAPAVAGGGGEAAGAGGLTLLLRKLSVQQHHVREILGTGGEQRQALAHGGCGAACMRVREDACQRALTNWVGFIQCVRLKLKLEPAHTV